jgi:hypothetical protein
MAYLLNQLIRDAMRYQGADAFDIRIATGGSTTTMEDTAFEDKYGDDELKDGTLLVVRTALGLAPEGEFSRISGYVESTGIATFTPALTGSIASGDTCMIISPEYPVRLLIELANDALRDCGEVTFTDSSTTTVAGQMEYELNPAFKRLVNVYYQAKLDDADDNQWTRVDGYKVIPSQGNVPAIIVFPNGFPDGHLLMFIYNGMHPVVSAYNSPINEAINPTLASLMLADKIIQWYGVTEENDNQANKINAELERATMLYPIRKIRPTTKFLTWSSSYVDEDSIPWLP